MARINEWHALTEVEVRNINKVKGAEAGLGELWREVMQVRGVDKRWAEIAKTHFQEGFMALDRALTHPKDMF